MYILKVGPKRGLSPFFIDTLLGKHNFHVSVAFRGQ